MKTKTISVNEYPDGTCRTIKSQYSKTAIANTQYTGSMGATMVAQKLPSHIEQNDKEQICKVKNNKVNFVGIKGKEVTYNMPLEDGTFKIRKLTPRECGRLMGFSEDDITAMMSVNSNSQCYKQCGNSIVVDVLEYIFKQLM